MDKLEMSKLTYKEKLRRIIRDGRELVFVENPTDEMCLEAVKENGYALADVKKPTREMCLEAVKNEGCVLAYVPPKFLKDDLTKIDYSSPLDNFKEEEIPSKLFISIPMRDKTVDEIMKSRFIARIDANRKLGDKSFKVIPSSILSKPPLYTLGKSLELLSTADVAYFSRGWENYRECRVEHQCAVEYGIKIIEG